MKERPIIFSAPMVRAILDGRKTQTRRVAKIIRIDSHPQDARVKIATMAGRGEQFWMNCQPDHPHHIARACPHGVPGDRLWVREAWHTDEPDLEYARAKHEDVMSSSPIFYAADKANENSGCRWRSPIHMPRWASRLTLEIVSVRVERVQEISEEDARAEGVRVWEEWQSRDLPAVLNMHDPRDAYAQLWESINGPGSWAANPWVWVIEFRRIGE